ncbi:hypothetical protein PM082_005147 [Marasmius tenuissimus]|nr:hypothetical protein PM082_005147 [Marasmius tenuissimus]
MAVFLFNCDGHVHVLPGYGMELRRPRARPDGYLYYHLPSSLPLPLPSYRDVGHVARFVRPCPCTSTVLSATADFAQNSRLWKVFENHLISSPVLLRPGWSFCRNPSITSSVSLFSSLQSQIPTRAFTCVHSTAGPLPPPPRASFIVNNGPGGSTPPPRPPRQVRSPSPTKTAGGRSVSPTKGITTTVQERERGRKSFSKEQDDKDKDMREALKLSPEVTAVLTSRLAPVTKVKSAPEADGKSANATARTDEHDRSVMPTSSAAAVSTASSSGAIAAETQSPAIVTKSVHMREGAFAPSTIISPMTTTPSTSTSSSTTPSIYPDANSPSLPTHTTQTFPKRRRRRKVASSSSYEEYTLEETPEEEDGVESEYDTCGRKVHESSADVAVAITSSQPVIKPPPRNQSLAATNAMGISGLPVEDEGWVLADNVGEGAVSYGKRSLDGIPKTPSRDRDKVPERHSLDSPSSSYESEGPSPPPKSFRNSFTKG